MFYFIKGTVALLKPTFAVVEAGGVGYKLTISERTHQALSQGASAQLFTHLAVREDGVELFGFQTEQEQDAFLLLTSVSGVGPKAAISILSQFSPDQLIFAIVAEDKKAIAKANGIGPKIAARIILELHDKLAASTMPDFSSIADSPAPSAIPGAGSALKDAQEALIVLGYNRTEILTVLQGIDVGAMSSEDIIRAALKKLMR